jgi:16S rRNA pseudouridine516 synthase
MRLDKLLSNMGFGSRKDVKQLLKKKLVVIDGNIETEGNMHVCPNEQIVVVDGEKVHYQAYVYLMLHKPAGFISATVDDKDPTVIDLVSATYGHFKLSPVGRLDKDTEGLLLLTNDGKLNHTLTSPNKEIYKKYYAKIAGQVEEEHITLFSEGIVLDDGYKTKKAFLEIEKSGVESEIHLSISEGKFHQVKRMFQAIGMKVVYLKRVQIGQLRLDDSLSVGSLRPLTDEEFSDLQK